MPMLNGYTWVKISGSEILISVRHYVRAPKRECFPLSKEGIYAWGQNGLDFKEYRAREAR